MITINSLSLSRPLGTCLVLTDAVTLCDKMGRNKRRPVPSYSILTKEPKEVTCQDCLEWMHA